MNCSARICFGIVDSEKRNANMGVDNDCVSNLLDVQICFLCKRNSVFPIATRICWLTVFDD